MVPVRACEMGREGLGDRIVMRCIRCGGKGMVLDSPCPVCAKFGKGKGSGGPRQGESMVDIGLLITNSARMTRGIKRDKRFGDADEIMRGYTCDGRY
jgi:hypothetical protein